MSQWRYKKRKQHIVVVGLVAVVLATLTFIVMRDNGLRFLDGVNLIFHEAGHLIFFFLPGILVAFAGTFVQLAVPIACVAHFLGRGARVAALVALWWVGESLVNVSIYIADARVQVLPLLGNGEHDWAYILGTLGVLEYDTVIASLVSFLGLGAMIGATAGTAWHAHRLAQGARAVR